MRARANDQLSNCIAISTPAMAKWYPSFLQESELTTPSPHRSRYVRNTDVALIVRIFDAFTPSLFTILEWNGCFTYKL